MQRKTRTIELPSSRVSSAASGDRARGGARATRPSSVARTQDRRHPDDRRRLRDRDPTVLRHLSPTASSSRASSRNTASRRSGKTGLRELLEHRAQATHDLDRRGAVLADLRHAQREVVGPASDGDDEPARHVVERRARVGEIDLTDLAKQVLEVVDHLHGGRRIVHRRRQRADRDVDHDPHRERRILLDRALDTERDHRAQLRCSAAGSAARPVDLDERRACRDEVADRMAKDDEALVRVRPAPEPVHVDRLDRAAALHPHDEHRLARCGDTARERPQARRSRGGLERPRGARVVRPSRRALPPRRAAAGGSRGRGRSRRAGSRARGSIPRRVTPKFGTLSASTCRMSVYEKVKALIRTPSTALNAQSR